MTQSDTLKQLLSERKGYRNDDWGGNKTFILNDVLYGEIACLFNSDTVRYCNKHYEAGFDIGQDQIKEDMTEEEIWDLTQDSFEAETPYYVEELEKFLTERFGTSELYAVWLTTKGAVKIHYSQMSGDCITGYEIPQDAMVISDLDTEGILIVTTHNPRSLVLGRESI